MSILFIGKRFYTNRDALRERFGRIYQLPLHWSDLGRDISLWLLDYHSRERVDDRIDNIRIHSMPVRRLQGLLDLAKGVLSSPTADVVVASGDAYIGMLGYVIARRRRAKFVFDVYDKYDEFGGYVRPLGFDLFGFLLSRADLCLFASAGLRDRMQTLCKRTALVPNGIDMEQFRPRPMHQARAELGLDTDRRYVGYFGSMEADRGIEDLLQALILLRKVDPRIHLLIGGRRPAELDLDAPGVEYMGNLAFEKVAPALASCDVIAIPYRRSAFMDAGASNKIAEALSVGRPVATTETPNFLANFPEQARALGPALAKCNDPESLAQAIKSQLDRPILLAPPVGFSWPDIAGRLLDELDVKAVAPSQ